MDKLIATGGFAGDKFGFGGAKGEVQADTVGCITIPRLKITAEPATLNVRKVK